MRELAAVDHVELPEGEVGLPGRAGVPPLHTSLRSLAIVLIRRWRMFLAILGSLMLASLLYCLIAPKEFEGRTRIALRTTPGSPLGLDNTGRNPAASETAAMVQSETVAGVLRSDRLAWRVILDRKLYAAPAFMGRFTYRYPEFEPLAPDPDAQSFLLERFQDRLRVETQPRTLLIEIRFRTRDPRLSATVVNALIAAYAADQAEQRKQAAAEAARSLRTQLEELKARMNENGKRLSAYERKHGILLAPAASSNSASALTDHLSSVLQVDELGKELSAASSERVLREAEYRAATEGDPEVVLAFDPKSGTAGNDFSNFFRLLHARRSDLEQELAQLEIERGPNFPRVLEIRQQLEDVDRQIEARKVGLREQFRIAWVSAREHERLVRRTLQERMGEGQKASDAAMVYEGMRQEADATHELYVRVESKVEEAGLVASAHGTDIWVVDEARVPAKPVAPDLWLYLAITLFVGVWIAGGFVLLAESRNWSKMRAIFTVLVLVGAGATIHTQAPTPSTSGLPTGVSRIPQTGDNKSAPESKDAPSVWNVAGAGSTGVLAATGDPTGVAVVGPIASGDLLEIGEFRTPEFRSLLHVSPAGTVKLPLIDEVRVQGMSEAEAARAIAAALVSRGILNHPQVSVLIRAAVGLDVSVLGEVGRPGVYPYTVHHRLFDFLSAASGVSPAAGGVVNIYHRAEPDTPHLVHLDPNGAKAGADYNPDIAPGDTVQVTRAGLVYVVGDVIRPGGFIVDPTQEFTVLKAISLAWGPSQNAAVSKALLIREQAAGRTVTSLNLKRMLRGKDPDQPVHAHDIIFVPDSTAKNLFNRSVESAIQSAAGVSIYSGLVYSQRF